MCDIADLACECLVVAAEYLDLETTIALSDTCKQLRAKFRPSAAKLRDLTRSYMLSTNLERFSSFDNKVRLISILRATLPEFDHWKFVFTAYFEYVCRFPIPVNAEVARGVISLAARRGLLRDNALGEICGIMAKSGPTERTVVDILVEVGRPCAVLEFAGPYALSDETLISAISACSDDPDTLYRIAFSYAETNSECSADVLAAFMNMDPNMDYPMMFGSNVDPAILAQVDQLTGDIYHKALTLCELGAPVTAENLPLIVGAYRDTQWLGEIMSRTPAELRPVALKIAIVNRDIDAIKVIVEWTRVDVHIAAAANDAYANLANGDSTNIVGYVSLARCIRALLRRTESESAQNILLGALNAILYAVNQMTY